LGARAAAAAAAAAAPEQVGHTIQDRGINEACGGQVLRVDVGLSKGCGNGEVQVLEILADGQQVVRLSENKAPQALLTGMQQQQQAQAHEQVSGQQQQAKGQQALPKQQQQPQQPPAGSGSSWLPGSWRSLWQDQQQGGGAGAQAGKHQGSTTRVEPTPA
jgi:hypothetical protein